MKQRSGGKRASGVFLVRSELRSSHYLVLSEAVLVTHTITPLHGSYIPDSETHLSIHITFEIYV